MVRLSGIIGVGAWASRFLRRGLGGSERPGPGVSYRCSQTASKIRRNIVNRRHKILMFLVSHVMVHISTPQETTFMDNIFPDVFLEETFPDVELPSYLQSIVDTGDFCCTKCGKALPKTVNVSTLLRDRDGQCPTCWVSPARELRKLRTAENAARRREQLLEARRVRDEAKAEVAEVHGTWAARSEKCLARQLTARRKDLIKALVYRRYLLRREESRKQKEQARQDFDLFIDVDRAWYNSNPPRTCVKCGETKWLHDFPKLKSGRCGGNICLTCDRAAERQRRKKLRQLKPKRTPLTSEEKLERDRKRKAKYRAAYRADPMNRINRNISQVVRMHFRKMKTSKPSGGWCQVVGYSLAELKAHIEAQFTDGMSWENYGEWHLDHIKPKASFAFLDSSDSEFLECWALSNLQPLWAEENIFKGAKYPYDRQSFPRQT